MMSETWSCDKGDADGHKGPHTTQHHPRPYEAKLQQARHRK